MILTFAQSACESMLLLLFGFDIDLVQCLLVPGSCLSFRSFVILLYDSIESICRLLTRIPPPISDKSGFCGSVSFILVREVRDCA